MSNCRDDVQETGVGSDKPWIGMKTILEGVGFAKDTVMTGLLLALTTTATAGDELTGNQAAPIYESVVASDNIVTALTAQKYSFDVGVAKDLLSTRFLTNLTETATTTDSLLNGKVVAQIVDTSAVAGDKPTFSRYSKLTFQDSIKAIDNLVNVSLLTVTDRVSGSDSVTTKTKASVNIIEGATANDALSGQQSIRINESAKISDALTATRHVKINFTDTAKTSAVVSVYGSLQLTDSVAARDSLFTKLRSTMRLTDSAVILDSLQPNALFKSLILTDSAKIGDSIFVAIMASNNWQDFVTASDDVTLSVNNEVDYLGQTWAANTENWAMSRYHQYPYKRLVVISGILYGENEKGVYRLDGVNENITAVISTGKLDLGQGKLVHPVSAYLEYALKGNAQMAVITTQQGTLQRYTYVLSPERSDELTNGRFIFGRGLRGRHFAFELTLNGTQGFINDLSISSLPTNRRV